MFDVIFVFVFMARYFIHVCLYCAFLRMALADCQSIINNQSIINMMERSLLLFFCVIINVYCTSGYKTGELYRVLNISCYEKDELRKACDDNSTATRAIMVGHKSQFLLIQIVFFLGQL